MRIRRLWWRWRWRWHREERAFAREVDDLGEKLGLRCGWRTRKREETAFTRGVPSVEVESTIDEAALAKLTARATGTIHLSGHYTPDEED